MCTVPGSVSFGRLALSTSTYMYTSIVVYEQKLRHLVRHSLGQVGGVCHTYLHEFTLKS